MREDNIGKIGNFDPDSYVQPAKPLAVISLIFGILSMPLVVFYGVGVFPGILGLVFALIADQRGNDSAIRKIAMIVSGIGFVVNMIILLGFTYLYACSTMETAETAASLIIR